MNRRFSFAHERYLAAAAVIRLDISHSLPEKILLADGPAVWVGENDKHVWTKVLPDLTTINNVVFKVRLSMSKHVTKKVGIDCS